MYSLDTRFKKFVTELAEKNNMEYSTELKEQLVQGITMGYHPDNTWENAEKIMIARIEQIKQSVA